MNMPFLKILLKYIFASLLLILTLFFSCNKSFESNPSVKKIFQILDVEGQNRTKFSLNDSIVISYELINDTDTDLDIHTFHGGPYFNFRIMRDTILVKDRFDGMYFTSVARTIPFPKDAHHKEEWIIKAMELSVGNYTAKVLPHIDIENQGVPPVMVKSFSTY